MATIKLYPDTITTTLAWTNSNNALLEDGVYATTAGTRNSNHIIQGNGFTHSIPDGSIINNVTLEVKYKLSTTSSAWTGSLIPVRNGSVDNGNAVTTNTEPTTDTVWQNTSTGTWLLSEIATAGVQFVVRRTSNKKCTYSVDYLAIIVDYTEPVLPQQYYYTLSTNIMLLSLMSKLIFLSKILSTSIVINVQNIKRMIMALLLSKITTLHDIRRKAYRVLKYIIKLTARKVGIVSKYINSFSYTLSARYYHMLYKKGINTFAGMLANIKKLGSYYSQYVVQRKVGENGAWETVVNLPKGQTEYLDCNDDFIIGETYFYRIKNVLGPLSSDWSNEQSIVFGQYSFKSYKMLKTNSITIIDIDKKTIKINLSQMLIQSKDEKKTRKHSAVNLFVQAVKSRFVRVFKSIELYVTSNRKFSLRAFKASRVSVNSLLNRLILVTKRSINNVRVYLIRKILSLKRIGVKSSANIFYFVNRLKQLVFNAKVSIKLQRRIKKALKLYTVKVFKVLSRITDKLCTANIKYNAMLLSLNNIVKSINTNIKYTVYSMRSIFSRKNANAYLRASKIVKTVRSFKADVLNYSVLQRIKKLIKLLQTRIVYISSASKNVFRNVKAQSKASVVVSSFIHKVLAKTGIKYLSSFLKSGLLLKNLYSTAKIINAKATRKIYRALADTLFVIRSAYKKSTKQFKSSVNILSDVTIKSLKYLSESVTVNSAKASANIKRKVVSNVSALIVIQKNLTKLLKSVAKASSTILSRVFELIQYKVLSTAVKTKSNLSTFRYYMLTKIVATKVFSKNALTKFIKVIKLVNANIVIVIQRNIKSVFVTVVRVTESLVRKTRKLLAKTSLHASSIFNKIVKKIVFAKISTLIITIKRYVHVIKSASNYVIAKNKKINLKSISKSISVICIGLARNAFVKFVSAVHASGVILTDVVLIFKRIIVSAVQATNKINRKSTHVLLSRISGTSNLRKYIKNVMQFAVKVSAVAFKDAVLVFRKLLNARISNNTIIARRITKYMYNILYIYNRALKNISNFINTKIKNRVLIFKVVKKHMNNKLYMYNRIIYKISKIFISKINVDSKTILRLFLIYYKMVMATVKTNIVIRRFIIVMFSSFVNVEAVIKRTMYKMIVAVNRMQALFSFIVLNITEYYFAKINGTYKRVAILYFKVQGKWYEIESIIKKVDDKWVLPPKK